jgi:hypothetical protein
MASLMPSLLKYWKVILLVLAFVSAGLGGYKLAQMKYQAEKARELQALITHYTGVIEKNKQINENLNDAIREIRNTERVVTEEVIRYVEARPDLADCELDADGLSLWNSASKTSVP